MAESILVNIEDPTDVAAVRRQASLLTASLGFVEVRAAEVAIVATELATNVLKHAGRGVILLCGNEETSELEVLALDQGSGMRDVERCLRDGYTTGSSPGQGLGAVRRLSTQSDFYSVVGKGTGILARWSSAQTQPFGMPAVGAVNVAKKGQEVCGDSWGIEHVGDVSIVMVADGLGHGFEASTASREAVRMLRNHSSAGAQDVVSLSHQALRSTRGAAIAVTRIDRANKRVTFCGLGNIMAQIYSGAEPNQHLVSTNGTAGHQIGKLREFSYAWPDDGILLMHSDGLATGTGFHTQPALASHDASLIAGILYRDFVRGMDDATVVALKAGRV